MPLGAENEQSAALHDFFVLNVGFGFVLRVQFLPLRRRNLVLISAVIKIRKGRIVGLRRDLSRSSFQLLRQSLLDRLLLRHELGVAPQQNVSTTAGHIGRDGDGTLASGLRHDLGFLLVVLGIQYDMLDALLLQQV